MNEINRCNDRCLNFKTDSFFGGTCGHPNGPLSFVVRDEPCQVKPLKARAETLPKSIEDPIEEFVEELFKVAYPESPPYTPYTPLLYNKQPFVCPVCNGNGLVPNGFYSQTTGGTYSTSSCLPDKCRTCGGIGIVWG